MPIYEYRCPACGHEFEKLQRMSDDPIRDCPECSGSQVKKLISRTSFVLKGGGWYKDHYGLKNSSTSSGDSSKSDGSKSSSDASKSSSDSKSSGSSSSDGSKSSSSASKS